MWFDPDNASDGGQQGRLGDWCLPSSIGELELPQYSCCQLIPRLQPWSGIVIRGIDLRGSSVTVLPIVETLR